jgi:uncharacterized transporter YbjL
MEFIKTFLEQQPMLALFLTIAIGHVVGEIDVRGFSLGVGAALCVVLATGWFAPKSARAPMIGMLGLVLFLYAVGRAVRQAILPRFQQWPWTQGESPRAGWCTDIRRSEPHPHESA